MIKSPETETDILQKARRESGNFGYSEKEQAKATEGSQMDLGRLHKTKVLSQMQADKFKTLTLYKKISDQLYDLIDHYVGLIERDMHLARKILDDILKRQSLQERILNKLLGKEESLNTESLEKELKYLGS